MNMTDDFAGSIGLAPAAAAGSDAANRVPVAGAHVGLIARLQAAGASAIALAGTDLLLAFDDRDPGFPVIDALEIHAAVLADLATGNKTLAEAGVLQ